MAAKKKVRKSKSKSTAKPRRKTTRKAKAKRGTQIPLRVLEKRLVRLSNIVAKRRGR